MADSTDKINRDEIRQSAGKEGEAAFKIGLNIDEVVHVYGDVLGMIADELRAHLASATKSFAFIKSGQVAPGGTTAMVLDRNLTALSDLIECAIKDAPPKPS